MSTALDPRTIEEEIGRIRDRESGPFHAGTRTNLFNLVIFREGAGNRTAAAAPSAPAALPTQAADPSAGALSHLLGKRPARIVSISPGKGPRTSAVVGGRCFPDVKNRGVCFEEIRIENGADGIGADPGTWSPLLIRHLPVFFWWLGRLSATSPVVLEASDRIDKLIVDTAYCVSLGEDPLSALRGLSSIMSAYGETPAISDLAWVRTRPLRVQAARLFDDERLPRLASISGVSIRGGSSAEATLVFLWLASRLGWRMAEEGKGATEFEDRAAKRIRAVHAGKAPLSEGFGMSFSFSDGGNDREISCGKGGCVSVEDEKAAFRFISDGDALLEEVDSLSSDALFLDALNVLK